MNGTPFVPVGVYDVNGRDDALAARDAGLSVMESMLPGLFEWGSDVGVYGLQWMIARTKTDDEITDFVEVHKDDPSNLAWYTFDEPNEVGVPSSKCEHVYDLIKAKDPERPVVFTVSPAYWYHPWSYSDYAAGCDILMTDPYPIEIGHDIHIDYVSHCIDRAREDSGKPVWAVLQAFPWPGKRLPTRQELRCMTYQALVHGASGILYYTYQVEAWNYTLASTPLWDEIKALSVEIAQLAKILAAQGPDPHNTSSIHIGQRHLGNSTYLIAVNVANQEVPLDLTMPSTIQSVDVMFEDRSIKTLGGSFHDLFDPLGVHVYRISDATVPAFALCLSGFVIRLEH